MKAETLFSCRLGDVLLVRRPERLLAVCFADTPDEIACSFWLWRWAIIFAAFRSERREAIGYQGSAFVLWEGAAND